LVSCGTPCTIDDREELGLKGNVRILAVSEYDAVELDGQIVKDTPAYSRTIYFAPDGRTDSVIHQDGKEIYRYAGRRRTIERYNIDGEPDTHEVTTYTAHGDIRSWVMYDAADTVLAQEDYTYDDRNRCIEKQVFSTDGLNLVFRDYTYDEAGRRTSYRAYNTDNTLSYGWQCAYDSLGRVTGEKWLGIDGRVVGSTDLTYNEQGFVAMEGTDNKYTNTYSYEYDAQGNYTAKRTTYSGGYDRPSYAIEERTIVYY
jgi:hypothetical protein